MKYYEATELDLEGIAGLFNSYRIFYKQSADETGARNFIASRLKGKDSVIIVAADQTGYKGFIQLYPTYSSISMKKAWILNDLYVITSARQQGIAQKLIELAIELCDKTKAAYLALETAPTNEQAKKLYERNGFILDDTFLHYQRNTSE